MNIETVTKEADASGVYLRRVVTTESGDVVSDERVKRDPVFIFTQPPAASIDPQTQLATVVAELTMQDFDGAARSESGSIALRFRDSQVPSDTGVVFTIQFANGSAVLELELDTSGEYSVTSEPPFPFDTQLAEPVRVVVQA
jgi:hypothetical protein